MSLVGQAVRRITRRTALVGLVVLSTAAIARPFGASSSGSSTNNPLGVNLAGVNYASPEQPFLNILKQAGSNSAFSGWCTATTTFGGTTGEEAYLLTSQADSDGYPTSVTGSAIGKTYNSVNTAVFVNVTAPGGTALYPSGSYTLAGQGAGTIVLGADVNTASLSSASPGISISAGTITSTSTSGTWTVTFNIPTATNAGIRLAITATDPSHTSNYVRALAMVQTSLYASYVAGAIFHPNFLATVSWVKSFRFKDWQNTDGTNENNVYFTATPTGSVTGATSCTLGTAWPGPAQTANAYFYDGTTVQQRVVTLGANSASVTWSGALTGTPGTNSIYMSVKPSLTSFANRSKPSNMFWGSNSDGVPLEICIALANLQGADAYINFPMDANATFLTAFHQLIFSGTGMQSGFVALASPQKCYTENSNEIWNFGFQSPQIAALFASYALSSGFGFATSPNNASARNVGTCYQATNNATIANTVWGASFAARCFPVLACQAGSVAVLSSFLALTTQYPGAPFTNFPIKAIAFAPYLEDVQVSNATTSAADIITITGQSDGGLSYFFQCFSSNVMVGGSSPGTLSSVPSNGWLGTMATWESQHQAILPAGMKLICYESGLQFFPATASGLTGPQLAAWEAVVLASNYDSRLIAVLDSYFNTFKNLSGTGIMHYFQDINTTSADNYFGILESAMQTISPITSGPAKYQAVRAFTG